MLRKIFFRLGRFASSDSDPARDPDRRRAAASGSARTPRRSRSAWSRSAGKPILGWVWKALASVGVEELVVIRGYRGDVLEQFVRSLVPKRDVRRQPRVADQQRPAVARVRARPTSTSRRTSRTPTSSSRPRSPRAAAALDRRDRARDRSRVPRRSTTAAPSTRSTRARSPTSMPDGSVARVGKRPCPSAEAIGEFIGLTRLGARGVATVAATLDAARRSASPAASTSRSSARRATATPTSPISGRSSSIAASASIRS